MYGIPTHALTTSTDTSHGPRHDERVSAAIAHAGTCVAWFLAPLLIFVLERDRSTFASKNALQALLWSALGTLVGAATCGIAIPVFMAFYAAVRAYEGKTYEYPLVGDVARRLSQHG